MKAHDTQDHFDIRTGAENSLIRELYETGNAHGINKSLWDSRRDMLYNMLLREGVIDRRTNIRCYDIPTAAIADHFGLAEASVPQEQVIWIPLSQFFSQRIKGLNAIRQLFPHRLRQLADRRFERNRSTDSNDYPHTSLDVRLVPDETAALCWLDGTLHLFATTAENPVPGNDLLYQGCMLRIDGAKLEHILWDNFHTWTHEDADLSPDDLLNPQETQILYQLLMEEKIPYSLYSLAYHPQERKLAVEIWTEPSDDTEDDSTVASFVMEDGLSYQLIFSYEGIRWHWMDTLDCE